MKMIFAKDFVELVAMRAYKRRDFRFYLFTGRNGSIGRLVAFTEGILNARCSFVNDAKSKHAQPSAIPFSDAVISTLKRTFESCWLCVGNSSFDIAGFHRSINSDGCRTVLGHFCCLAPLSRWPRRCCSKMVLERICS